MSIRLPNAVSCARHDSPAALRRGVHTLRKERRVYPIHNGEQSCRHAGEADHEQDDGGWWDIMHVHAQVRLHACSNGFHGCSARWWRGLEPSGPGHGAARAGALGGRCTQPEAVRMKLAEGRKYGHPLSRILNDWASLQLVQGCLHWLSNFRSKCVTPHVPLPLPWRIQNSKNDTAAIKFRCLARKGTP